jgi:transposase
MSQMLKSYPKIEVQPQLRPQRRKFTAEQKLRLLQEADQCKRGELGSFLRREGLYSGQVNQWRKERESGTLRDKRRGPTPSPERAEVRRLQTEVERLNLRLKQAEAIIAAQKKLASLLETLTSEPR